MRGMQDHPEPGFDWLREERADITALRFHVFGNRDWSVRSPGEEDGSHSSFLRAFGETQLYRNGFGCHISIRRPERTRLCELVEWPNPVLEIAAYTEGTLFMEAADAEAGRTGPLLVHAHHHHSAKLRVSGTRFDVWLRSRAALTRKRYSKREWRYFAADPPPFTDEEESILEAREHFDWTVVRSTNTAGRSSDEFTITNRSCRTLPVFTIGVKETWWIGATWLDVSAIPPGGTAQIRKPVVLGYDKVGPEAYCRVPRPLPEERDLLRELWPAE